MSPDADGARSDDRDVDYQLGQQEGGSKAANPERSDGDRLADAAIRAVPGTEGQGSASATARRTGGGGRGRRDGKKGGGRRRKGRAEEMMVPDATFTSYYGRQVVKATPWEADIPFYLFAGGLAGGSTLLAAGADLSGRPHLRRNSRIVAAAGITTSLLALVHDLGRPERFYNMLRVFKPTSPMSVGTWILSAYGPFAILAAGTEVLKLLPWRFGVVSDLVDVSARPAGLVAAAFAPAVASYTAVLLTDTSTPAWHDAHRELPFVFVGSAAAASGGLGMALAPLAESGPARALAVIGATVELVVEHRMEGSMGLSAEALHLGTPGRLMRASKILTAAGAAGALLLGRRSRAGAVVSGLALVAGSVCTRFGVFEAGQESARDPRYTVIPQRERLDAKRAAQAAGREPAVPPTSQRPGPSADSARTTTGPTTSQETTA
ncbi:Formate-dependent nitrite reductase, membrane component NrfD [Microlunatus sagamiharensis]|uniref:Formate-dependent nitrite reductase, membrane component NrfD n=1 Tax=Microlunatus sagamiharensis TaxID=546874 RepID=A0A1H2LK66_9ACTN|nr:NrfD/PsrC family molybdoenzyme membrane anchor subunit [Microlunatus sagamiharensis]SDU81407.1 Formate-dependent nitrite reductase, membrane component NrfD [Microlunatus sagamiharensis]